MIDGERIVIAGGGVGGLALALMLGRAGRQVTLVERDRFDDEPDPEAAFATTRPGVAQTHQTHGFLARLRLVLRDRLPDVLAEVEAAGAQTLALTTELGEPRPGDEDLAILIVRRTTLEWVLRRAAAAEPNVEIRSGVGVDGLVAAKERVAAPPHVVGAQLDDGELLRGTVVACTGSRGDVPAWLADLGVTVSEDEHRTKLIYLTRWYRLPADHPPVELGGRLFGDLGYLRYLVVPGDGGTLSATLAVHVRDAELRARLLDEDRFDRAVRRLPGPDRFFVAGTEPIGPVRPMAGLVNRLRRFVDEGGEPLVTGFHAVGDAHTCTNPLYGRGCALAMVQAGLLADAFALHPDDPLARAAAYEKASAREVEPWFHGSVQMDKLRDKVEARAARRRSSATADPADRQRRADQALDAVVHAPDEATAEGVVAGAAVGREIAGSGDERLADNVASSAPGDVAHPGGGSDRGAAVLDGGGGSAPGGGAGQEVQAGQRVGERPAEEEMDEGEVAAATFGRIMVEGGSDPVIGRAIVRLFNLLALPHELMADADLLARVAPLLAKPPLAPPAPEGPSLEELLA